MAAARNSIQVLHELLTELGMRAVLNDQLGALVRILSTQVSDALFGDDHLDGMFAVVEMADQWNDSADLPAFRRRRTAENAQVRVASEVARSADSVHQLLAHHMRAVYVPEYVRLDRGVDGDDAQ